MVSVGAGTLPLRARATHGCLPAQVRHFLWIDVEIRSDYAATVDILMLTRTKSHMVHGSCC